MRASYEQKSFLDEEWEIPFRPVASPDGNKNSLTIHQDVRIYLGKLEPSLTSTFTLLPGRYAWLQVLRGFVNISDNVLTSGDGAAISQETDLAFKAENDAEIMLFDLC